LRNSRKSFSFICEDFAKNFIEHSCMKSPAMPI
jgi:hypothetical protein